MAKIKLNHEKVEVIKHLLKTTKMKHKDIGALVNISREQISKINKGLRWDYVDVPSRTRGQYLYYKLLTETNRDE